MTSNNMSFVSLKFLWVRNQGANYLGPQPRASIGATYVWDGSCCSQELFFLSSCGSWWNLVVFVKLTSTFSPYLLHVALLTPWVTQPCHNIAPHFFQPA